MAGKLELQARSPVFIDHVVLYPELANKLVKINLEIQNTTAFKGTVKVSLTGRSEQKEGFDFEG